MNNDITIKDVLNNPQLKGMKVLAGESGLNRKVKSITVMDAPDPFPWTKGDEIVLSSGYIFKINIDKFSDMIKNMKKFGIAALFIKLKRFFHELPKEIVDIANKLEFPIVEVPVDLAFIEVINPVLIQIIDHQSKALKISEEIHNTFSNIVINNEGTQVIIDFLGYTLNEDILYYDLHFQKMYFSKDIKYIPPDIKEFNLKNILEKYNYYAIGVNNEVYGYIIYLKNKNIALHNDNYNALTHANTAIILNVQKKISSMQIEERHKNEFVQDIIMNNIKYEDEIKKRATIYGWNFSKEICVMVIDIDNFKAEYLKPEHKIFNNRLELISERIFKNCIDIAKTSFSNVVYGEFSDSIAFLIQLDTTNKNSFYCSLKKMGNEIREVITRNFEFTVTVSFGSFKSNIMDIHKSYNEAILSIKIARILYKNNVTIFYKDLGVYRLLYSIYKNEEAKEFYISSLEKIINHDEKYNSELLKTLICILENDWNLKTSAKDMYIHYNTIKYRYKKICELLDEDLNENEVRLKISLAIKIYQMID